MVNHGVGLLRTEAYPALHPTFKGSDDGTLGTNNDADKLANATRTSRWGKLYIDGGNPRPKNCAEIR
jgi:hypothetical protein